ncbi:MAG: M48 family metallopeptidase [Elusimicrobiota bacterium]
MPNRLLAEVRGFLDGLRLEWPEVFAAARCDSPASLPKGRHAGIFHARASFWAERLGVTFGSVRIKGQRTLWGSCSRQGNLNFNWRLTLAPVEVMDYVVLHEVAHLLEMNHSPRFWEIVARHCPEHKTHRRWLRKNSAALYLNKESMPAAVGQTSAERVKSTDAQDQRHPAREPCGSRPARLAGDGGAGRPAGAQL